MTRLIDNNSDNTVDRQTPYQGEEKPVSSRGTSLSFWGLALAVVFLVAVAIFIFSRGGAHTDPAPNGPGAGNGATSQAAPSQNSP